MANRLADETSAYLRQHQENPVEWLPWGEEAFARARTEDKPVLVSIGYSACHWCHVMAHETFEDRATAAQMNEHFVNVKVDREERPDVDQIYMDAVVRMTGHGGWPLTAFCTPDGKPFYAGTYFPPERRGNMPSFREVLASLHDAWSNRRDEVEKSAAQILAALRARPDGVADEPPGTTTLVAGARAVLEGADRERGGFGRGPKFPTPTNLELLLAAADVTQPEGAKLLLDHVLHTCREMARLGLYDHLGGGFHRYCVDGHWGIPHFEKMLYDQGLLLRVYAEAYRRTRDDEFVWPIRETVAYLQREMKAPEGGFYASQDADSEGVEGRFFVWKPQQLREVLDERADAFAAAYGVTEGGNFEHATTHLRDLERAPRPRFAEERAALLRARSQRIAPGTDEKRVAAWNGYTISGLARAASALEDETLLQEAVSAAEFALRHLRNGDGRWHRVFNEGRAHVPAFLDDHAALLDAFLDLHRAGGGDRFVAEGVTLAEAIVEHFFDENESDLFLAPAESTDLVHRPRSDNDGATPHAGGLAVIGLLRMAALAGRSDLRRIAERVIRTHAFLLERAPHAYPTMLRAAGLADRGLVVAVIVGAVDADDTRALAARARRVLRPEDAVLVHDPSSGGVAPGLDASWLEGRGLVAGRAAAYVCRGTECSLPTTQADALDDWPSLFPEGSAGS